VDIEQRFIVGYHLFGSGLAGLGFKKGRLPEFDGKLLLWWLAGNASSTEV